jgi:hypothetical protein
LRTIIISKSLTPIIVACLVIASLPEGTSAATASHSYDVAVDKDLSRIEVTARFAARIDSVFARSANADHFLIVAEDCDSGRKISSRGRRLQLPETGIRCLKYAIDLGKAAREDRRNDDLLDSNVVASPGVWMWRPRLRDGDEIEVRLQLPEGVQVSLPWPSIDGQSNAYRVETSPQSGSAIAAFGKLDTVVARIGNVELPITYLRSSDRLPGAPIIEWVRDNANNITLVYGRFPNPLARVVVLPQKNRRGDSAVQFGRVVRDGGETVELLVDPTQPIESFYDSWTATHEFSHLMLPYVHRDQRWISEGFAQYYQNILLARAGRYTQQYAWQKLHDGLQRGRDSAPALSPNAAASADERDTRMKVYWSGAALALIADTELRLRSGGKDSLDDVLDRFQRCCLPSPRTWSGIELLAKFDSLTETPVFVDLYKQYAETPGFPATSRILERLGIELRGTDVHLRNDAELAEIRAALTARRYTGRPGN